VVQMQRIRLASFASPLIPESIHEFILLSGLRLTSLWESIAR